MKKALSLVLVLALVATLFTGCVGTTVVVGNCTCPSGSHKQPTTPPAQAVGALKTGLSVSTSLKDSVSATADKAGEAKYDVTLAAVTVDDKGVIASCVIDSIPATVAFDASGAVTSDLTAAIKTKNELGDAYGMVAWGGAKAEWDAQAAAFAQYVTGKTAAEVAGIAITETTKPADGTDLAASVTITIGGFQALIAKAMA